MFWEKKLAQWVEEVKTRANLPARLVLWDGQQHDFGQFAAPQVTLHVKSATALPYLLEPSLDNLGEAYVKGKIDIEGKLSDIINISYQLARNTVTSASKLARVRRYFQHSKSSDKKAIQYHYDVSNEFYKLWLDENMVYSCAYFENGDEDLATAQIKKIDHILTKIQLQPGQRLLDIGCGWGALVLRAAQKVRRKVRRRDAVAKPVRSRDCTRESRGPGKPDRDSSAGLSRHRRTSSTASPASACLSTSAARICRATSRRFTICSSTTASP